MTNKDRSPGGKKPPGGKTRDASTPARQPKVVETASENIKAKSATDKVIETQIVVDVADKPGVADKPAVADKAVEGDKPAEVDKPDVADKAAEADKPADVDKPDAADKLVDPDKPGEAGNGDTADKAEVAEKRGEDEEDLVILSAEPILVDDEPVANLKLDKTPDVRPARIYDLDLDDGTGEDLEELFKMSVLDVKDIMTDEMARVVAERDQYLLALQRLQADTDNMRKRALRQQTETLERANETLLAKLLPVLDAVDLALAHAQLEGNEDAKSLLQIGTLLHDVLGREGLARIDKVGVPFDPKVHDAVAAEPADGEKVPTVGGLLRAGYVLKGRVIRPAMVMVRG